MLDSLYEDEAARRQIQLNNSGYGNSGMHLQNPFEHQTDPFILSNNIAPPSSVQMAMMAQQQQQLYQQQIMLQQQQNQNMTTSSYQYQPQHSQQQAQQIGSANPFGDPFTSLSHSTSQQQGNHMLL